MNPSDIYLDQVQAATEAHPTWEVDEVLRYVFTKWTKQDPEEFIAGLKEDMRKAEDAPPRHPFEVRS